MQSELRGQLIETIPLRHSVRKFLPEPLPEEYPEQIINFAEKLELPFEHNVRIVPFKAEPGRKLYNNGINPVDNLAVMAETDLLSVSKAGFVGELVMLYTVSLGLSACWFGHYKLSEVGRYIEGVATADRIRESTLGYGYGKQVDVGERVICCMPFGRDDMQTKRLVDVVAGKNGAKRKPLEELLEDPGLLARIPADIQEALELAKLAPSAANSQMWRFGFSENPRTVTVAKPAGYKHFKWEHPDVDIGMCAAHLWLSLLDKGLSPTVNIRIDGDRAFWSFGL